jgi:hypothetical protein
MDHKKDGRAVEELKAALLSHKKEINAVKNDPDKVYAIINRLMTAIAKAHDISGQKIHDMWVNKYKEIPDTWIMEAANGLWANIHAKQKRIKNGSGEHMRKPGSKGAPTDAALKASQVKEDAKGYKNPTGGLTKKGRDHYNRETGGNLKAPVTTPPSKLKKGSKAYNRRKSFCARMSGVEGPMKKPNGEPTRKALALKKWNC